MKLKNLLDERGLDQQQLAIKVGVSQSKVSRWCTGKNLPDIMEGMALSRLFCVSIYWLTDDSRPWPYRPDEPGRPGGVVDMPGPAGSDEPDCVHEPVRKLADAPANRTRKR